MSEYKNFLKEVKTPDMKEWRTEKQSVAVGIIETFLNSNMQMAEIDLENLPEPVSRGSTVKSTKQDSFASSFYAWKKKLSTQELLQQKGIDIILIRRGDKLALKKK